MDCFMLMKMQIQFSLSRLLIVEWIHDFIFAVFDDNFWGAFCDVESFRFQGLLKLIKFWWMLWVVTWTWHTGQVRTTLSGSFETFPVILILESFINSIVSKDFSKTIRKLSLEIKYLVSYAVSKVMWIGAPWCTDAPSNSYLTCSNQPSRFSNSVVMTVYVILCKIVTNFYKTHGIGQQADLVEGFFCSDCSQLLSNEKSLKN